MIKIIHQKILNKKYKIKRTLFNSAELCTHRKRVGLIQTRHVKTIESRRALALKLKKR